MAAKKPKRHHYVPEFYIRFFVDAGADKPVVWVYDKEKPTPRPQLPKDTAVEMRFNTVPVSEGGDPEWMEAEFSRLETVAAPILERWQDPRHVPTGKERAELAYFLAALHCRVRRSVEVAKEMLGQLGRWVTEDIAAEPGALERFYDYARREEPHLTLPPIDDFRQQLREADKHFKIEGAHAPSLALSLIQMKEVAQNLLDMNWCRCFAPTGAVFITSDAPVAVFLPSGPLAAFGVGFALPQVEISFPLSPTACLFMDRKSTTTRRRPSQRFVDDVNRRTAYNAERFVIANVRTRSLQRLVEREAISRSRPKWDATTLRQMFARDLKRRGRGPR